MSIRRFIYNKMIFPLFLCVSFKSLSYLYKSTFTFFILFSLYNSFLTFLFHVFLLSSLLVKYYRICILTIYHLVLILFNKVLFFLQLNLTLLCFSSFLFILFSPFFSRTTFLEPLKRFCLFYLTSTFHYRSLHMFHTP